jgi:hypothetical protein
MPEALFLGWQEDIDGGPLCPLFNVLLCPVKGSYTTVSMKGALERGYTLPAYPDFKTWKENRNGGNTYGS